MFTLRIARRLAGHWRNVEVILVDQRQAATDEMRAAYSALGWRTSLEVANIFEFLEHTRRTDIGVVTANMFLHHFPDADLARLLAKIAQVAPLFVAGELRRTKLVREAGRYLWLLGAGDVICNDGRSARGLRSISALAAPWRLAIA